MNIRSIRNQIDALRRDLPQPDPDDELSDEELDRAIERLRDEIREMGDDPDEGDGGLYRELKRVQAADPAEYPMEINFDGDELARTIERLQDEIEKEESGR